MAIINGDGFDQYADITGLNNTRNYITYEETGYTTSSISTAQKRTGSRSVMIGNGNSVDGYSGIRCILPSNKKTIGVSMGIRPSALTTILSPIILSNSTRTAYHLRLRLNANGGFDLLNSTGTIIQSSANSLMSINNWYHIEMLATIDSTNGSAEVRFNGNTTPIISVSGISTINGANDYVSSVFIERSSSRAEYFFMDDLVIWDTTGTENNTFFGPVSVGYLPPNGDIGTNTMTPNSGSNLYSRVSDVPPDGDTSYVTASNQNDTMNLTFPSLDPTIGKVYGVVTNVVARKYESGSSAIRAGLNDVLSETLYQDFSYQYQRETFNKNPATGLEWTLDDMNSIVMNVKREI